MNNLITQKYFNPYFAVVNNKEYKVNNIIIYNESGVLINTSCGWFNESNNHTKDCYVKNDILKVQEKYKDKHIKEKHNFIIKNMTDYDLYIYCKNVDYKVIGFTNDYFIGIKYTLFNNDNNYYNMSIGNSTKISDRYYNDLRQQVDELQSNMYRIKDNLNILDNYLKSIKKLEKEYINAKEVEKHVDIKDLLYDYDLYKECYKNNLELLESGENK